MALSVAQRPRQLLHHEPIAIRSCVMGKRNFEHAAAGDGGAAAGVLTTTDNQNSAPAKRIKLEAPLNASPSCCGQEFALRRELVDGAVLTDLAQKHWRVGKPIGKGSFGEIFLASDDCTQPVTSERAAYVVKIEPHSNGPLFVEIHCLINAGKPVAPATALPPGMPAYIASGSHHFGDSRYRFLILRRYQCDLAALVENRQLDAKAILSVAVQIVDVLEHLHDRGYAHSDIKAANLMLGSCTYERGSGDGHVDLARVKRVDKELRTLLKQQQASGEVKTESADRTTKAKRGKKVKQVKQADDEEEVLVKQSHPAAEQSTDDEFDDDLDESSNYKTPQRKFALNQAGQQHTSIPYSGTNPMRSCRLISAGSSSTYQDMLSSHYLRPTNKVDYGLSDSDSSEDADARNSQAKADKDFIVYTVKTAKSPARRSRKQRLKMTPKSTSLSAAVADASRRSDWITEDRIHLIDFGLAIKFVDSTGQHRPFFMDARRAHDGTLEFTSRDAHMGAHSRRSDLECFGYNLLYWTQGWLPWKEDARGTQQPEQVHRMKELFMTDVPAMFRHVYNREVPAWIGQFMRYVGSLAYHDRPDYELCRNMFRAELRRLGVDVRDATAMRLRTAELQQRPVRRWEGVPPGVRPEAANGAAADHVDGGGVTAAAAGSENVPGMVTPAARSDVNKSMLKLGLLLTPALPFREVTSAGLNRISPKNLRSKSEKVPTGRRRKDAASVFSWTDILSTDPDQIARQRADKEFDRVPAETPLCHRYKGKPTYAILEVLNRIRFKDRIDTRDETPNSHAPRSATGTAASATVAGHKQRHLHTTEPATPAAAYNYAPAAVARAMQSPERRKSGLRTAVRHTPKSLAYRNAMLTKRRQRAAKRVLAVPHSEFSTSADEESSSSSSSSSNASSSTTATTTCSNRVKRATKAAAAAAAAAAAEASAAAQAAASDVDDDEEEEEDDEPNQHHQHHRPHVEVDDDDDEESSRDTIDYSPVKTRRRRLAKPVPRVPAAAASVMQRKAAMRAAEQMSLTAAVAARRLDGRGRAASSKRQSQPKNKAPKKRQPKQQQQQQQPDRQQQQQQQPGRQLQQHVEVEAATALNDLRRFNSG